MTSVQQDTSAGDARWYSHSADDVVRRLGTDRHGGLAPDEVEARQKVLESDKDS